jgi:hypothetical protein
MDGAAGLELASILAGSGVAMIGLDRRARQRRLAEDASVWRLVLPSEVDVGSVERLVLALHGVLRPRLRRLLEGQPWFAVELVASSAGVEVQLWVPAAAGVELVSAQVEAAWPGVQLIEDDLLVSGDWTGELAGAWLVARGEGLLRTDTPTPGLAGILGGLQGLGEGEQVVVQLLIEPASPRLQAQLLRRADHLLHGQRHADQRVAPTVAERGRAARLQAKASRPLYRVCTRVLAASPTVAQAERRVAIAASGWHQFGSAEVHFSRRRPLSRSRLVGAVRHRHQVRVPAPSLLNSSELAAVLAVTPDVARANRVAISATRRLPAPAALPDHGIVLGMASTTGGERPAAIPLVELTRHVHVMAGTGAGKSTLLAQIAIQAIRQGAAVVLMDGKDELADLVLPRVPRDRVGDVAVLDLADREHVWALNPLTRRGGDPIEVIADDVLTPIRDLFAASWGQRSEHWIRTLLLTLLSQPGEPTLLDAGLALHDDEALHRLATKANDPLLQAAWRSFFNQSDAARAEILAAPRNKLASLVMGGLRGMLGGPSTVDLDALLNGGGVVVPRFSKARLGEDTARLGASLFMTMVWQAIRRRAAIPAERRRPLVIIADEFQDFVHLPTDFEAVLSQARSLGAGAVLAHQELHQLPPGMRHAVLANARTRCVFALGADDARVIARDTEPHLNADHLRALPAYEIAVRASWGGGTTPPFTARTLPLTPADPARADDAVASSRRRYTVPHAEAEADLRRRLRRVTRGGARPDDGRRFGRQPLSDRVTDRPNEDPAEAAQPRRTTPKSDRDTPGASR